ncbi:MAG: glyoxylate carboligase [Bacilli bacterium]
MPRMNVMDAVVAILQDEGVDVCFGIPGAAILPLYQALSKTKAIRNITVRHEEGATHAADGFARATGKVGVAIGTSGPAGTNMVTGLYTAWADSIPIITITGQAVRSQLHREGFQAVDITAIVKPVVKQSFLALEPAQVPWVFREAFRIAREGRPGPVHIDIPLDVQKAEIYYDPQTDRSLPIVRSTPNQAAVEKALDLLLAAKRPLILSGGGVVNAEASAALTAFAEYLQTPVALTLMGWGSIPADHPLHVGTVGIQTQTRAANKVFLEADFVLAVGARFADRHTGDLSVYTRGRKFVQIDVEPTQIGRILEPELGIASDAQTALEALLEAAKKRGPAVSKTAWAEHVQEVGRTVGCVMDLDNTPIHPARVFKEINDEFGADTIFTTAIGLYQIWSGQFQRVFKPRHYLVCGQAGPLGWEIPAALGVKQAFPDKEVVAIVGDYSFQFLMEEIAVGVQYRLPFLMIMINNAYLGLIRQSEIAYDMNFGVNIDYEHTEGWGIDHVGVVSAMGGLGVRVADPAEIAGAIRWARAAVAEKQVPVLVEILVEREANAAMGASLDTIKEYSPVFDATPVAAR